MRHDLLSIKFLSALDKYRSVKPGLVHDISDILDMDETSVYRRLRGAVKFTVDEIGLLAQRFNISLDDLISELPEGSYQSWKMDLPLIVHENGFDMDVIEQNIPLLRQFVEEPVTEAGGAIGFLTRQFFMQYKELSKFMLFKWGHYFSDSKSFGRFDTVEMPDRLSNLFMDHITEYRKIKHTFYIWDHQVIAKLVDDIRYFKSMSLVSAEDVLLIKNDIYYLLDYYENAASKGRFEETGNTFELYISPINIDTSHSYMRLGNRWFYSVEVYGVRSFLTFKPYVCEDMQKRINRLKEASVLISSSAEKVRILFFRKQREIVDSL